MDRDLYRAWLAELAVGNLRSRKLAEPELARKEAVLSAERARLRSSQAAVQELEAELQAERQDADGLDNS